MNNMLVLILGCSSDPPQAPMSAAEPAPAAIPVAPTCGDLPLLGYSDVIPWQGENGPRLSVIHYYADQENIIGEFDYYCYRISVLDPQTGETLVEGDESDVLNQPPELWAISIDTEQQLWMRSDKTSSVEVYHLPTGEKRGSMPDSSEERLWWDSLNRPCRRMHDGTYRLVNLKTLESYLPADTEPPITRCNNLTSLMAVGCNGSGSYGDSYTLRLPMGDNLFLFTEDDSSADGARRILYISETRRASERIELAEPFFNLTTRSSHQYVLAEQTTCDVSTPEDGNWLLHTTDLRHESPQQLSFIEKTGAIRWTIPFPYQVSGRNTAYIFVHYGDFAVFETNQNLIAINMDDGAIRWKIERPVRP